MGLPAIGYSRLMSTAMMLSVFAVGITSTVAEDCTTAGNSTSCIGASGTTASPDGENVVPISPVTGAVPSNTQLESTGGYGATDLVNGGDGGSVVGDAVVDVTIDDPNRNQHFSYYLNGGSAAHAPDAAGSGGNGGSTGSIDATVSGQGGDLDFQTAGGTAGDPQGDPTGPRGNGGNAGNISLTVDGDFDSIVVASGGGATGTFGTGTGGHGGDGGDVVLEISGHVKDVLAQSTGGDDYHGTNSGDGGSVLVTLRGEVLNDVTVRTESFNATPGDVTVVLQDGSKVGGKLVNASGQNGELQFVMQVASQDQLNAATASINDAVAGGLNGTVTVAGQTYEFEGFASLKNYITILGAQNPGQPVTITFSSGGGSTQPGASFTPVGGSRTLAAVPDCDGSRVIAVVKKDGSIQLNVKPIGERRFVAGWIVNGKFVPTGTSAWTVTVAEGHAQILDATGQVFAHCTI